MLPTTDLNLRRGTMTDYIRPFSEITKNDIPSVGGKGANLGELTHAGLPVPPGFCVTADAYRTFIEATHVGDTIRDLLAATRIDDAENVEKNTAQIRELLTAQPMPPDVAAQVLAGYSRLAAELGTPDANIPVAVRSSATAEDLPGASFAGQQDTYLNIRGNDALLEHVRKCWASLWTARAVTYRVKQSFDHSQVALAVVVQAMIQSEVAGILFTANPVTHSRDELVINASWGLGEAIVSGLVSPDTWIIRKADGAITLREIADKDLAIHYAPEGGTVEEHVAPDRRTIPSLSDSQLAQLTALGIQVEAHYAVPMDIEWGLVHHLDENAGFQRHDAPSTPLNPGGAPPQFQVGALQAHDKIYLLQARPITTLEQTGPAEPKTALLYPLTDNAPGEYNRTMFIEIFPDPLSPAFLSVVKQLFQEMLDFTVKTLGFDPPRDVEAIGIYYNQPYFHRDYVQSALAPLSPHTREALVAQLVNPFGKHERNLPLEFSLHYLGMVFRLLRLMLTLPNQLPGLVAEYRAAIDRANTAPLDNISDAEISEQIRTLVFDHASKLLDYDFLMIALIGLSYQTLGTLLTRYYGDDSEQVRAKLVSGVTGNVTMETNKQLWDLAQAAKRDPQVASVLRQSAPSEDRAQLEESSGGRAFLTQLDQFLAAYGHREVRMDIMYPTWGEDPTPVFAFIRAYLDVDESSNPHNQQARLVKEREALAQDVNVRLQRDLRGRFIIAPIFRWILAHTQKHTRDRDTMHFELTRLFPSFRRFLNALAARWIARGILDRHDDVYFLMLDEIIGLSATPRPMQEQVRARRAEFEANSRIAAPGIVRDGKVVDAPLPTATGALAAGQYRGIAGSPGRVTGAARVIRGPDEFDRLQNGDILIAPLTNPVWTPLFAIAGGLVTEVGGILSHGAIVAREYGIPAVMAVPGATQVFHEGQRLTVDGNKGIVSLE